MDQEKIGRFIALRRKEKNLTQNELASKLFVTDRAVSKWECGRSLPDSSIMLSLCEALDITVNELLTGEKLQMKDYNKQAEANLLAIKKQKEESDKRLLIIEIVMCIISALFMIALILLGAFAIDKLWLKIVLIAGGLAQFFAVAFVALLIEQKAGYYECPNCHEKYVPTYAQVLFAVHVNRTRYIKCPHCKKYGWHKKIISK